jgi:hypothetical protein
MPRSRNNLVCFNRGEKVIHDSIPSCKCPEGFTGTHCQTRFFNFGFAGTPAAFLALLALAVLLVGGAFRNSRRSNINRARREIADKKVSKLSDLMIFV